MRLGKKPCKDIYIYLVFGRSGRVPTSWLLGFLPPALVIYSSWTIAPEPEPGLLARIDSGSTLESRILATLGMYVNLFRAQGFNIRPYLLEYTGSRLLSPSQASKSSSSSWVGDDQRMPGVVCFFFLVLVFAGYRACLLLSCPP